MKRISKLLHLLLLLIFMSVLATEVRAGAFYVWCEGNATLYFLNSEKELKAGDSYDGQTITNVWNDPYTWEGDGKQHKFPKVKLGHIYAFVKVEDKYWICFA